MQAFQVRVVEEKAELDEKRTKLDAFLGTELFAKLDETEQGRLRDQAWAMEKYSSILGERITAFV